MLVFKTIMLRELSHKELQIGNLNDSGRIWFLSLQFSLPHLTG